MHFLSNLNHALSCIDSRQQLAILLLEMCTNMCVDTSSTLLMLMKFRGFDLSHPFEAYVQCVYRVSTKD